MSLKFSTCKKLYMEDILFEITPSETDHCIKERFKQLKSLKKSLEQACAITLHGFTIIKPCHLGAGQ